MRIYVAGPFEISGKINHNVRSALEAGARIMRHGHAPYVPHPSYFFDLIHPFSREKWLEVDRQWLLASDCVLRLPGESPGVELEVRWAEEAGIPVFGELLDAVTWWDASIRIGMKKEVGK